MMEPSKILSWDNNPTYNNGLTNYHNEYYPDYNNIKFDKDKKIWYHDSLIKINECENYWRRLRLAHAFKIDYSYNTFIKTLNKLNPCEYLLNLAKSKRKLYAISGNLSKDCFIDLMQSSEFQVVDWNVICRDDYERGFNLMIKGYYLYY